MRWALLLVFTLGCAIKVGNEPDPRASCQTAGWVVDGPNSIALHREVTFHIAKCRKDVDLGKLSWSVSDQSVIRVVDAGNDYALIKAEKYGMADIVVLGPQGGQFTMAVAVE